MRSLLEKNMSHLWRHQERLAEPAERAGFDACPFKVVIKGTLVRRSPVAAAVEAASGGFKPAPNRRTVFLAVSTILHSGL